MSISSARRLLPPAALSVALLAGIAGCASVERSRSLSDQRVSGATMAQQVCSSCHGMQGIATSPNFPHLAAQPPAYLESQLKAFRSRQRSDPAGYEYMWGVSSQLSDQQITALSAYYAQLPAAPARSSDVQRERRGKTIYAEGIESQGVPACVSCHGAQGEGLAAFPRLAGQHADYVAKQLEVFQRTDERPEGAVMKTIVHSLTQEDIRSLAAYVQSM